MVSPLVSCEWLKEKVAAKVPGLRILDGTWNQPAWKRDAEQEYLDKHIESAVRFNISDISDKTSSAPLMLPPPEQFQEQVGKLGISNDTHIVVYDNNPNGFYSAGRVWWMFKTYGHDKVSILDGGLPKWIEKGYPTVSGLQQEVETCTYKATYHPELYRTLEQMRENHTSRKEQVVDARPKGRYDGKAPEPNPKIRSGHMHGSINFPFTNVIDPQTKTLKDSDSLKQEGRVIRPGTNAKASERSQSASREAQCNVRDVRDGSTAKGALQYTDVGPRMSDNVTLCSPPSVGVRDRVNGSYKEGRKEAFQSGGVDLSKPIILTCGGAMVAPLVTFALSLIGSSAPVYDGSWAQWVNNASEDTMLLGVKGEDLN